jgi:hypothetical protein
MDDYLKCKICSPEKHEPNGWACRCEGRNIRVAKERRARGEKSGWQDLIDAKKLKESIHVQPDRLNPEDGFKESKAISDSQNIVHK